MCVNMELQLENVTIGILTPSKSITSGTEQSNPIPSCSCGETGRIWCKEIFDNSYNGSLLLLHFTVIHCLDLLPRSFEICWRVSMLISMSLSVSRCSGYITFFEHIHFLFLTCYLETLAHINEGVTILLSSRFWCITAFYVMIVMLFILYIFILRRCLSHNQGKPSFHNRWLSLFALLSDCLSRYYC